MKKTILIIGGDSCIAQNFVKMYDNEYNFFFISRKKTYNKNETVLSNFFKIEIENFDNIDVVINFAAIVHQPKLNNPKLYYDINTKLPIHIAEKAKKHGVSQYIQMSSIAVYGNNNSINSKTVENPIDDYGKSKYEADIKLSNYCSDNFIVTLIRPPMVYGDSKAPGNMMKLINYCLKGRPLPLKNVNNKRDFIHINNLSQVINICVDKRISGIILPTDKQAISSHQIGSLIVKYSERKIRFFALPAWVHYIFKVIMKIKYAKLFGSLQIESNLGDNIYEPINNFEDGIEKMIKQ